MDRHRGAQQNECSVQICPAGIRPVVVGGLGVHELAVVGQPDGVLIMATTGNEVKQIRLGFEPSLLAYHPDGSRLAVVSFHRPVQKITNEPEPPCSVSECQPTHCGAKFR